MLLEPRGIQSILFVLAVADLSLMQVFRSIRVDLITMHAISIR
jgi:hypothetical protein